MADIDAAVSQGGLRWALFGPRLSTWAAARGGLGHFMDHLLGPVQTWWDDLGARGHARAAPAAIAGVNAEAGGRSIAELAQARDADLTALLKTLRR